MFHISSCEHSPALWGKCNFAYVELTLIIDHKKNSFLYFSFEKSRIFAELIYIKSI